MTGDLIFRKAVWSLIPFSQIQVWHEMVGGICDPEIPAIFCLLFHQGIRVLTYFWLNHDDVTTTVFCEMRKYPRNNSGELLWFIQTISFRPTGVALFLFTTTLVGCCPTQTWAWDHQRKASYFGSRHLHKTGTKPVKRYCMSGNPAEAGYCQVFLAELLWLKGHAPRKSHKLSFFCA